MTQKGVHPALRSEYYKSVTHHRMVPVSILAWGQSRQEKLAIFWRIAQL